MRLPRQPRPVGATLAAPLRSLARARSQARLQRAYRKPIEHAHHGETNEHQLRRQSGGESGG